MKHVSRTRMNHRVAAVNHRPNRRSSLLASLFWMIHCCLCLFPFHNNNNMAQAQSIIIDTTIAAEAAATAAEVTAAATADYADFLVTSDRNNILNTDEHFVVRITDPAMIAEARAELDKFSGFKIISGFIEKTTADWNPRWSYHFTPSSIFFGDFFIEVCDASATYVEENLSAAGGSFLPRLQWCPWGTRVLAEITSNGGGGPTSPTPPPQQQPTMAPVQPPPPPARCAARGEICTDKMTCCSTDDFCRGVCARKTTNTKAGDKSNLKLDYDGSDFIRGMRGGTRQRRQQRRILKGSS